MSRSRRRLTIIVLVFTGICVLLFRWAHRQTPGVMERFSSYLVYPLLLTQRMLIDPIKRWSMNHANIEQLKTSIAYLQSERDELMAENIELRSQLQYIDDTKLLAESNKHFGDYVLCNAQIIAKNFSEHEQYFLIDAGSSKGMTTEMSVIAHNCLLGKVTEVYPWYSKVVAITDTTCKIAACCYKTKTAGIHEGTNNINATRLNFVSHLDPVVEGDFVFSSGEGLVFPRGLGIGQVIATKQEGLYQLIEIKPLADLNNIQFCSVLRKGAQVVAGQTAGNTIQQPEPKS